MTMLIRAGAKVCLAPQASQSQGLAHQPLQRYVAVQCVMRATAPRGTHAVALALSAQVRKFHHIMGGVVDPHAAYLLLRGMKTLDLRVERHNRSAMEIARRLSEHKKVRARTGGRCRAAVVRAWGGGCKQLGEDCAERGMQALGSGFGV